MQKHGCALVALKTLLTISVLQGFVSNADYSGKKTVLVVFINGRPVDCSPLKRALEATYAAILPKAAKPWVFLVEFLLIVLQHMHGCCFC